MPTVALASILRFVLRVPGADDDLLHLLDPGHPRTERDQLRAALGPVELDGLGSGVAAGRPEVERLVLDDDLVVVHAREPPEELPVRLVVLLRELVRDTGLRGFRGEAVLARQLLGDLRRAHVLEGRGLADAVQPVRAVVAANREQEALLRELRLEAGDLSLEDGLRLPVLRPGEGELEGAADHELPPVHELEQGIGESEQEGVGEHQVLLEPKLDHVLDLLAEQHAVDPDLGVGDLGLGDGHSGVLGIASRLPRRRRSGSSMPFASAIGRQRVASP